jgi:hypothetical protein
MSLLESCLNCPDHATCFEVCPKLEAELAALQPGATEFVTVTEDKMKGTDPTDSLVEALDGDDPEVSLIGSIWPDLSQRTVTQQEYEEAARYILKRYSDLVFPRKDRDRGKRQHFQHYLKCMPTEKVAKLAGISKEGMRKQLLRILKKLGRHLQIDALSFSGFKRRLTTS